MLSLLIAISIADISRYTVPWSVEEDPPMLMFNAIDNVMHAAAEHYWAAIRLGKGEPKLLYPEEDLWQPSYVRAPCGGEANCAEPYLADNVLCWVDQTDCWAYIPFHSEHPGPVILRTYVLECAGNLNCLKEGLPSEFCCTLIDTITYTSSENGSYQY